MPKYTFQGSHRWGKMEEMDMKGLNQAIRRWLVVIVSLILVSVALLPSISKAGETSQPGYVALGESIEAGFGATNFFGYVPQFNVYLTGVLGTTLELHNFSVPGATTKDIEQEQLAPAVTEIEHHRLFGVVVSWGGGGSDLYQVAISPQVASCRQQPSCLARINAQLNNTEARVDRIISELRNAAGPESPILIRTEYNFAVKQDCGYPPEQVALIDAAYEGLGVPGTILDDRGLNDRLRKIAAKYDAQVIEIFEPFSDNPDEYIGDDCVHPSDAGHELILERTIEAYQAATN